LARRIPEILDLLEASYGRSRPIRRFEPMEELVSCILSQHTADANSFPAFTRLRAAFPDWAEMEAAGPEGIEPWIQAAGLARQKAKSIHGSLSAIRLRMGSHTLDPLLDWPLAEARDWLESLPGVGPKTAAIVLCFALGRPAIPVDTHVSRVSRRLGLLSEGLSDSAAHHALPLMTPEADAHRLHALFIQHGRKTCFAQRPACAECPLAGLCRWNRKAGRK
jgi:endonuclease-3